MISSITTVLLLGTIWSIALLCVKDPTRIAKFLSSHIKTDGPNSQLTKGQQMAKAVREHPNKWGEQYPELYWQIRVVGIVGNVIFALSLLIFLMSRLVPPTP